jgi:hypothetical protein
MQVDHLGSPVSVEVILVLNGKTDINITYVTPTFFIFLIARSFKRRFDGNRGNWS